MAGEAEIEELRRRRKFAESLGGADNLKRHHGQGRLTVRERLEALTGAGSFQEVDKLTGNGEL